MEKPLDLGSLQDAIASLSEAFRAIIAVDKIAMAQHLILR